jgi:hypothetical protein
MHSKQGKGGRPLIDLLQVLSGDHPRQSEAPQFTGHRLRIKRRFFDRRETGETQEIDLSLKIVVEVARDMASRSR